MNNGEPQAASDIFDSQQFSESDAVLKLKEELIIEKANKQGILHITPRRKFSLETVTAEECGQVEYNIQLLPENEKTNINVQKRMRLFVGESAQIVVEPDGNQVLYVDVQNHVTTRNIVYNESGELVFLGGHAVRKSKNRYSLAKYPAVRIERDESNPEKLKIVLPHKNKKATIQYVMEDGYLNISFVEYGGTLVKESPVILSVYDMVKSESCSENMQKPDSRLDMFIRNGTQSGIQMVFYSIHANPQTRFVEVSKDILRDTDESHLPYHQNVYSLSATRNYWLYLREMHTWEPAQYSEIKNWHDKSKCPCRGFKPLKSMADEGLFEQILRPEVIDFLKKGFLPMGCSVHHNIPLAMQGENANYNYVLMPYPLHMILHNLLGDSGLFDLLKPVQRIVQNNNATIVFRMPVLNNIIFCKTDLYQYFSKEAVDAEYDKLSDDERLLLAYYENLLVLPPQRTNENDIDKAIHNGLVKTADMQTIWQQQSAALNMHNETNSNPVFQDYIERNWGSGGYSEEKAAQRRLYVDTIQEFNDNGIKMLHFLYYLSCLTNKSFFEKSRQFLTQSVDEFKKVPELVQFLCILSALSGNDITEAMHQSLVKGLNHYIAKISDESFEAYVSNETLQVIDGDIYNCISDSLKDLNKNRKMRRLLSSCLSRRHAKQAQIVYTYYYLTGENILQGLKSSEKSEKAFQEKINKLSLVKRLLKNKQLLKSIAKGNFELICTELNRIFPNVADTYVKNKDSDMKNWLTEMFTKQVSQDQEKWDSAHDDMNEIMMYSNKFGVSRIIKLFRAEVAYFYELLQKVKKRGLLSAQKRTGKVFMSENVDALEKIITQSWAIINRFKQNEAYYLSHTAYENTFLFDAFERKVFVSDYVETIVFNVNMNKIDKVNSFDDTQKDNLFSGRIVSDVYHPQLQAANSAAYYTGYFSTPVAVVGQVLFSYRANEEKVLLNEVCVQQSEDDEVQFDIKVDKPVLKPKIKFSVKDALTKQAASRIKAVTTKVVSSDNGTKSVSPQQQKAKRKIIKQVQKQRS